MLEGTLEGTQRCSATGIEYRFEGHFLGDEPMAYLAWVTDADDRVLGYVEGKLALPGGVSRADVCRAVEAAVRQAIAAGEFTLRR